MKNSVKINNKGDRHSSEDKNKGNERTNSENYHEGGCCATAIMEGTKMDVPGTEWTKNSKMLSTVVIEKKTKIISSKLK